MLHCPNADKTPHPAPAKNQFVTTAMIRIGPAYELLDVYEYLDPDAVCSVCGARALTVRVRANPIVPPVNA